MEGIIRIATAVPKVSVGRPDKNADYIIDIISSLKKHSPDIILFPALCLSGASCGTLFKNRALLQGCENALDRIKEATKASDSIVIVGLPESYDGRIYSVCAVIYHGNEIAPRAGERHPLPPLSDAANAPLRNGLMPSSDAMLNFDGCAVRIIPGDPANLPVIAGEEGLGADVILCPCAHPTVAGSILSRESGCGLASKIYSCAVATCGCGFGEATSPYLYKGFTGIYECGQKLNFTAQNGTNEVISVFDADIDIIRSQRAKQPPLQLDCPITEIDKKIMPKGNLLRNIRPYPFLPSDLSEVREIFDLQVSSLMGRISNSGIEKLVIGVSGGVDTTVALLACYKALKSLGLPSSNCIAVNMPGFGTTNRTRNNALSLIGGLNATHKEISIEASVLQHFEDIGHSAELKDLTFENAQARERSQILFDIANIENALVVGAGDLSEDALGWCTFGGDHLATFNINTSIPKTLVSEILRGLSRDGDFANLKPVLDDILNTPVSPELLPPDEAGNQLQETESILGPYKLHDFFLYYFIEYNLAPTKIFEYAKAAFKDEYDANYIKATLVVFIRRFFAGQFKRNCSPDSAMILTPCLSPEYFTMPSDASSEYLIDELIKNI